MARIPARGMAAEAALRDVPPEEPPPEALPEELGAPEGDLEGALSSLDAAIADLPPEAQEKIREYIEAIRDVAASAPPEETPPPAAAPEGALPGPVGEIPPGMA